LFIEIGKTVNVRKLMFIEFAKAVKVLKFIKSEFRPSGQNIV